MRQLEKIAVIRSDFPEKFGIPRQSGIIEELKAEIIFEPSYRDPNCVMGLEDFSHIWLIWEFSGNLEAGWSPTVIPPRLGGRIHKGVFATRSPFRPNPIGLSCVKLTEVLPDDPDGPVILVQGPDLMDGTPILDIKPYIPYADSIPDAASGFLADASDLQVRVVIPEEVRTILGEDLTAKVEDVLKNDPRPTYQNDPDRVYGVLFGGYNITFHVEEDVLHVLTAEKQLT